MNLGCRIDFARRARLWTPSVEGGAAQAPGRKHHGLGSVGRSLQDGLDTADQLDSGAYARSALRRDHHHSIAFVQIGKR